MNIMKQLVGSRLSNLFVAEKTCRTRLISEYLFECRVRKPDPRYCEYSRSMGNGFICNHPDRRNFVNK